MNTHGFSKVLFICIFVSNDCILLIYNLSLSICIFLVKAKVYWYVEHTYVEHILMLQSKSIFQNPMILICGY